MQAEKQGKPLFALSALGFVAAIVLLLMGSYRAGGLALILGFVAAAIAVRSTEKYRVFGFTLWIFAIVAAAMFYPDYVRNVGPYDTSTWIVPFVQLIMFGMGTALSAKDFGEVLREPRSVLVGMVAQFTIMPFVAVAITTALRLPPEIAAGVILVGSVPGGVASNVICFIARGNLALSVTLTACSTLMAPIMTPFLMTWLAGESVPMSFGSMMMSIIQMVVIPIGAALLLNVALRGRQTALHRAMPSISMILLVLVVGFITAAGRDNLMVIGPLLILAVILHSTGGYVIGYWFGRAVRLDEASCRTIAIEVGLQNGGLAGGLATQMGQAATTGLAPAVFSSWQNISGSVLASWWRSRPVKDGSSPPETVQSGAGSRPSAGATGNR